MPSNPSCCPEGAEPLRIMRDYTPAGEYVHLEVAETGKALPVYVSRPAGYPRSAVVMFTDMFGPEAGRHKQLCDMLAAEGWLVACPGFFVEEPYIKNVPAWGMTPGCFCAILCGLFTGRLSRITRTHTWEAGMRSKVLDTVLPYLAGQGASKFAAVGFCWGGYGVFRCGAVPGFIAGASFHPSTAGFCRDVKEDDIAICRAVKCPQLVYVTKQEPKPWLPGEVASTTTDHAVQAAGGGPNVWQLIPSMNHGYMTRGDTSDAKTAEQIRIGFDAMVEFFKANGL